MIHFLILNISDINKFFVCRVWEKLQTWKSSTIFLPFRSDWMKSCSRICLLNFILDRKYSSQKREENSTHWNAVSSLRDLFRRAWNLDQAYWNFHKKIFKTRHICFRLFRNLIFFKTETNNLDNAIEFSMKSTCLTKDYWWRGKSSRKHPPSHSERCSAKSSLLIEFCKF